MISDTPDDAEIQSVLSDLDSAAENAKTNARAAKCIRWLQHEMNTAYWNDVRRQNTELRAENARLSAIEMGVVKSLSHLFDRGDDKTAGQLVRMAAERIAKAEGRVS